MEKELGTTRNEVVLRRPGDHPLHYDRPFLLRPISYSLVLGFSDYGYPRNGSWGYPNFQVKFWNILEAVYCKVDHLVFENHFFHQEQYLEVLLTNYSDLCLFHLSRFWRSLTALIGLFEFGAQSLIGLSYDPTNRKDLTIANESSGFPNKSIPKSWAWHSAIKRLLMVSLSKELGHLTVLRNRFLWSSAALISCLWST